MTLSDEQQGCKPKPGIRTIQSLSFLTLWASAGASLAHGGGLDRYGCHNDNRNGGYHCHSGSPSPAPSPTPAPTPAPTPPAGTAPRFTLKVSDYDIVKVANGYQVILKIQRTTVVTVTVVRIQFADAWLALDIDGVPGSVYRLYRAAFRRTPDAAGLGYHLSAVENSGLALRDVSNNFQKSPEFTSTYGTLSNTQFVTLLYRNVLGREPDAAGLAFHVGNLDRGSVTRQDVLLQFAESPENKAAVAPAIASGIAYQPFVEPAAAMRSPFARP